MNSMSSSLLNLNFSHINLQCRFYIVKLQFHYLAIFTVGAHVFFAVEIAIANIVDQSHEKNSDVKIHVFTYSIQR